MARQGLDGFIDSDKGQGEAMWNREENEEGMSSEPSRTAQEARRSDPSERTDSEAAVIGHSTRIQGEVTGDEDLTIQGYVAGSVNLNQRAVTVGAEGEVEADVAARLITVAGTVEGDLTAEERIVVRSSGRVAGDLEAPRVVLEDGARFRGEVRMDRAPDESSSGSISAPRSSGPAAETGPTDDPSGEQASKGDGDAGDDASNGT